MELCPSIPSDACPSTVSMTTGDVVKLWPKVVPLDHPHVDLMVPEEAVGMVNLYCAHPGNSS